MLLFSSLCGIACHCVTIVIFPQSTRNLGFRIIWCSLHTNILQPAESQQKYHKKSIYCLAWQFTLSHSSHIIPCDREFTNIRKWNRFGWIRYSRKTSIGNRTKISIFFSFVFRYFFSFIAWSMHLISWNSRWKRKKKFNERKMFKAI